MDQDRSLIQQCWARICIASYFYTGIMVMIFFQWECKADLDNAVRFGKINVYCEGYDYPDDPYILKGSCGVCDLAFSLI